MMMFPQEVRDTNPLESLRSIPARDDQVARAVTEALIGALPNKNGSTVFSLGLTRLFVHQIWDNMGERSDANASAALHSSLIRDPYCPGFSHYARAVLALTLCSRWGGSLGPIDQELRRSLQALTVATDQDAVFWAEYIGAVAAAIATVVPAWPRTAERVADTIRFSSTVDDSGKSSKINLTMTVNANATTGIDLEDLEGLFKNVGKMTSSDGRPRKIKVQIRQVSKL
jgi:retrograde regulation protein 2